MAYEGHKDEEGFQEAMGYYPEHKELCQNRNQRLIKGLVDKY